MASGIPSSRRQIDTTSGAVSLVDGQGRRPGLWPGRRTARPRREDSAPRNRRRRVREATATAPGRWSPRRCRAARGWWPAGAPAGSAAGSASAVLAQAPIRCSQLSSTIRMSWGARASSRVSRTGRPGCPAIPSACGDGRRHASWSATAASSTSQTPSPDPSSSSAATCRPSLVLPAPSGPGQRDQPGGLDQGPDLAPAPRSRPMNVASWAGRLFGSAGLPSERSGGNSACRPAACSWKICSGRPRSFSRCTPRSAERRAGRKRVAHQGGRRLRQQDLAAVRDRGQPGRHDGHPGPPGRSPSRWPRRCGSPIRTRTCSPAGQA